jgi:thiol:disulfide interchange protein/DsbC/DsbD-like thiol-disulfide interchange protein
MCVRGMLSSLAVRVVLLVLLLGGGATGLAEAAETAPFATARDRVSLVTDTDTYAPGTPLRLGLRFQLAPGWHIYWKNPGEAGAPPTLHLDLPQGAGSGDFAWPAPERISEGPVVVFGYTGDVLLPLPLSPPSRGNAPLAISAHATWLVCARICVPEEANFHLDLPAGHPAPAAEAALFAAADARMPRVVAWPAVITPEGHLVLTPGNDPLAATRHAYFFPDQPGLIDPEAAQPESAGGGRIDLALAPQKSFDPTADLAGVLEFAGDPTRAVALRAGPGSAPPIPEGALPLAESLLFGLLGGLILNLMPCVFPVLAMKAVGLARLAGAGRGAVLAQAFAYMAGTLATFAALGGTLIALRGAGDASGWGFQFQSPAFVAAMAWLLFGVGLNLSGVYTLGGGALGGGLAGLGQTLTTRHGVAGSFFTGLLAVLVATPCTAPFMGAAIAAAMAAPKLVALAIFLAMGLGLAAPYVLLALLPGLAGRLPRPGRWMDVLRQGLAFPMYGACAWLAWVVAREAGSAGVLGLAAGLVLLGFAAWTLGQSQQAATAEVRRIAQAAMLTAVLASVAVLSGLAVARDAPGVPIAIASDAAEQPYSPAALASLRASGRPVLVNMTAAWCVTCLVNERMALTSAEVRRALADRGVVYMVGDWTRQDPAITAYLRQFGRDGVPLYVLYPGGDRPPMVLPQILTETSVLAALERVHQKEAQASGTP